MKILRKSRKLSQQALADALHCSQQTIAKYENNIAVPPIPIAVDMADLFETSIDYIIGRTNIPDMIVERQDYDLNIDEQEMINIYRELTPGQRDIIKLVAREYIKNTKN